MKKIIVFLIVLIVGVICSACINTYAVNQLNKFAAKYSEDGNTEAAIARLESSIDLDGGIYETRYNLAVLYLDADKCDKALEQVDVAQGLIEKEEPALYYIRGAANACIAKNVLEKKNNPELDKLPNAAGQVEQDNINKSYVEYLQKSVDAFEKYVQTASVNDRNPEIINRINGYRAEIQEYSVNL